MTDFSRSDLGFNQQPYERLKACLGLSLRRQILIAVCDDLHLRNRLAMQLQAELSGNISDISVSAASRSAHGPMPQIVTLELDLQDPNPLAQVSDWLSQRASSRSEQTALPTFQILGIERLTRQSAAYQNLFLAYLQEIEAQLPEMEAGLLLWMTQPWFRMLPEAVPEFWRCRTGLFEFVGDPTPLLTTSPERIQLDVGLSGRDFWSRDFWSRDSRDGQSQDLPRQTPPVLPSENPWLVLAEDLTLYEPEADEAPDPDPGLQSQLVEPEETPDFAAWIAELSGLALNSNLDWLKPVLPDTAHLQPYIEDRATDLQTDQASVTAPVVTPAVPVVPAVPALTVTLAAPDAPAALANSEDADLLLHIGSLQQQIAMLETGQESPVMLATAYRTLGNFYRDCIEQGDTSADSLAMAIQAYEQSLDCLPTPGLPELEQAEMLNDLGNLYWMLAQTQLETQLEVQAETVVGCLQRTLYLYQLALNCLDSQQPETYAMLQNNLGGVYADLARYQEPVPNLEQSVQAYQQALQSRTAAADPIRYASTQNNLGTTYWNLAQHQQPAINLKQAIIAYVEALNHYSPDHDPLHYAMIQNNLGTAYWNLAQYEPPEDAKDYLMLASLAYQSALQHRRLENHPTGFAATQNNLGTAYWHLANQTQGTERLTYLEQAITAYEMTLAAADALSLHQPDASPSFDLCSTQNNLGLAHYQLATEPTAPRMGADLSHLSHHLHLSLQHHLLALQGWEDDAQLRPISINCIVQTVRAFYSELGLAGQSQALALLPSLLLAEILPRL